MFNSKFIPLAVGLCLALAVMATDVPGQSLQEMNAAMNMNDTLNGANTGPAAGAAAQEGATVAPPPPLAEPPVVDDENGAATAFSTANENKVKVIAGQRVYDVLNPDLMLDDARVFEVPESQVEGKYFDDGRTGGDEIEGDGYYTNIEVNRTDYISPRSNDLRRKTLSSLIYNERLKPLDFYMMPVIPVNSLDENKNAMALEERQDRTIMEWANRWLAKYRRPVEGIEDERLLPFYSVYIPHPPSIPDGEVPANFDPSVEPGAPPAAAAGAGGIGGYGAESMGGYGGGMGGMGGAGGFTGVSGPQS